MFRLIQIHRSNSMIWQLIPGRKKMASQHPDVVSELDGLIKNARTVSTIGKFNFPEEQDEPESARAHEK